MIHNEIRRKFDEYKLYVDDPNIAMLCAVLDVRLLGLMNSLPDGWTVSELRELLMNFENCVDDVTGVRSGV